VQLALDRVELGPAGVLAAHGRFVPLGNALADDGIRRPRSGTAGRRIPSSASALPSGTKRPCAARTPAGPSS
ncbi:hypothetical protein, partial [Aeromonas caviae]|uniref:hypothetical protein n=1 Tax=Aeromonas caviae TaxID=648 RepID=UPI001CC49C05